MHILSLTGFLCITSNLSLFLEPGLLGLVEELFKDLFAALFAGQLHLAEFLAVHVDLERGHVQNFRGPRALRIGINIHLSEDELRVYVNLRLVNWSNPLARRAPFRSEVDDQGLAAILNLSKSSLVFSQIDSFFVLSEGLQIQKTESISDIL